MRPEFGRFPLGWLLGWLVYFSFWQRRIAGLTAGHCEQGGRVIEGLKVDLISIGRLAGQDSRPLSTTRRPIQRLNEFSR